MYYNGDASKPYLGDSMHFRRTLVEFSLNTDWLKGPKYKFKNKLIIAIIIASNIAGLKIFNVLNPDDLIINNSLSFESL